MTSLRGNLSTVDLANILQMLQMNQREGTLYITGADGRRAIYFGLDGVSTLSRGGRRHGALGQILVRQGVIDDDQLRDAVRRQSEGSARMIGQVLVEQGLVKREQVEEALRVQIEEEIYDLFITKDAQFEFVEGDVPEEFADPDGVNRIAVNVNGVIMEAAQRIDEWEWIQGVVPDSGEIYRYTGLNVPLDDEIFHERATGRVLTAIDGRKSIDDLIEASYVERFDVCKVIALLLQGDALEPVPPEALREEAGKSIEAGDTAGTIKFLARLVDLHAETPETHRQLAEAYESESELERAAFHYRVFGETRIDCGDTGDAFRVYHRIFQILPTDLAAADRMVEVFALSPAGFETHTAEVIETGKTLAEVYVDLGRGSRAIQVLHRIVSLAPDDAELRSRLIEVYLSAGMTGEAVSEYEVLAESALAIHDHGRAERIYRKILTIEPGRNDVLRRLNQLISRKTRRRRSVRNSIAAAGIVTLFGVAGWYGIRFMMERQIDEQRGHAQASARVADLRDRHSGLDADLKDMVTRLASSRADDEDLLTSLQDNRVAREALQRRSNQAVRDLMAVVTEHAGSQAADEARAIADGYNAELRELERLETDAITRLAASAQRHYTAGKLLAEKGSPARTQWATFDHAMSVAAPCAEWLASPDGTECQAFHASLREVIESLSATKADVDALLADGDTDGAWARAVSFLHEYPPPDLADELRVPIQVISLPAGATITLNDEDTGLRTPATLLLPVRRDSALVLNASEFEPTPIALTAILDNDPKAAEARIPHRLEARLQRLPHFVSSMLPGRLEAPPSVVGGHVIVPTRGAETAIVEMADGARSQSLALRNPNGGTVRAIVSGDIVATPTVDGRIYFHRLSDRKLLGAYEAPGELRTDPIEHDGLLIAATSSGHLVAVDIATRGERWRYPQRGTSSNRFVGGPVLSGGELVLASPDGTVHAVDPATGALLRSFRLRTPGGSVEVAHGITVHDDAIYAVTPRGTLLKASQSTGAVLWSEPVEVRPVGPPLTNGSRIVVVGAEGRIVSVRAEDAQAAGEHDVEANIVTAATLDGDALFVSVAGGRLQAFDVGPSAVRLLWMYLIKQDDGQSIEITTRATLTHDVVLFGADDNRLRAVVR